MDRLMHQDSIDAVMWRYESSIQYRVEIYDPTDGTRTLFGFYEGLFGHVSVDFDFQSIKSHATDVPITTGSTSMIRLKLNTPDSKKKNN